MTETNRNRFVAWVKIHDYESAQEAIRQTYVIGFTLAFIYGFGAILLISTSFLTTEITVTRIDFFIGLTIPLTLLPLWAGFRIKSGKLGLAPLMIICGWAQAIYLLINMISQSIDLGNNSMIGKMISYFLIAILVARGWNAFEAYNQIREGMVKKDDSNPITNNNKNKIERK